MNPTPHPMPRSEWREELRNYAILAVAIVLAGLLFSFGLAGLIYDKDF